MSLQTFKIVLVVTSGLLMVAVANGIRQSFGLYLLPISETLGWSRETFALGLASQNLMWGFSTPLAGILADKVGSGKVLAGGTVLYSLGLYVLSGLASPVELMISMILIASGLGGVGFALVFAAVGRSTPPQYRSLMIGIVAAGSSLGQFGLSSISQTLIDSQGWRSSLEWMSLVCLVMIAFAFPMRDSKTASTDHTFESKPIEALKWACFDSNYRLLFIGFFVCGFHVAFIAIHFPAFLVGSGFPASFAATCWGIIALGNLFGTLSFGYLGDRISKRKLLCFIYSSRALLIATFISLPVTPFTALGFSFIMGTMWLSTVPLTSGLVSQIYGSRYLSTLFGVVFLGHQMGSFLGAWLGGRVYDMTGSYTFVWWMAVVLGIGSSLVHWPIKERSADMPLALRSAA